MIGAEWPELETKDLVNAKQGALTHIVPIA